MKKYTFEKVNEDIYKEVLDNGLEIYLYPTKKTKNFYITISVKYGSRVCKYKIGKDIFDIIPGSAHFLEHKVMAISENKEFSRRINKYGSLANAWTNNYGTNYNIYGSKNIKENIKLLLDIFYNTNINDENVNAEKGIIGEEIDMYKDRIDSYMADRIFFNLFNTSYKKYSVTGEREDIEKINAYSLNKIYEDFYIPSNTFIGIYGDFNKEEVVELIKNEVSKYKFKNNIIPERIIEKEELEVFNKYELIEKNIQNEKVKIGFKIKRDKFDIEDNDILISYLDLILSCYIDPSSKLFERYKNNRIILSMNYNIAIIDDYVIIIINSLCEDSKLFIDNMLKDIVNIKIKEEDFERKKKVYLKYYISSFDEIDTIEYVISMSLMSENRIDFNEYSDIISMNTNKANELINSLTFDNYSVLVCK